jgi:septal ring factor EnvC (AmiA/AmiB activator)
MSLLPFLRNFIGAEGGNAAAGVVKALVQLDPDSATVADLRTMEQDLDNAGRMIAKLRTDLTHEQTEFDSIGGQYHELMAAAELLQKRIGDPGTPDLQKQSLNASLATLVAKIEHMAPELDRDKRDVESTRTLLAEAEAVYQQKAEALTNARKNLDSARHDLQHARIEEQRSVERARQAATVAGLRSSPTSGLTVALNVMQQSAQEARQRAEAMNMKAEALTHLKEATADQNVAAALAEVRGTVPTKSLSERLSALRR